MALRSFIFISAISFTWALVILPTLLRLGTPLPFSTPAALRMSCAVGGVPSEKVNELSL